MTGALRRLVERVRALFRRERQPDPELAAAKRRAGEIHRRVDRIEHLLRLDALDGDARFGQHGSR